MRKLGDAMNSILPPEVLRAGRALSVLKQWDSVVGTHLAARSSVDQYVRGIVWVSVQGSAWAQEMRMHRETFLEELNSRANEPGLFVDIRFGVRPVSSHQRQDQIEISEQESDRKEHLTIREIASMRLAKMQFEKNNKNQLKLDKSEE